MYKGIFLNSKDGFSDNEISESILQKFEAQIVKKKIHVTDIAIQIFPMHPVRC